MVEVVFLSAQIPCFRLGVYALSAYRPGRAFPHRAGREPDLACRAGGADGEPASRTRGEDPARPRHARTVAQKQIYAIRSRETILFLAFPAKAGIYCAHGPRPSPV